MNVLVAGGSGLLGRHLRKLRPNWMYPTHSDLDVGDIHAVWPDVDVIVHAAAVTSTPRCNDGPMLAMRTNIVGTCAAVAAASIQEIPLVYVSTDYVFNGIKGWYAEEDSVHPTNLYGWSKLGGECAVRMYDKGLIVRGSFSDVPYPHPRAFVDQWMTRLPVDEFASRLVQIVERKPVQVGVIHLRGKKRTTYDYARSISGDKQIDRIKRSDVSDEIPVDTSLVSTREDVQWA